MKHSMYRERQLRVYTECVRELRSHDEVVADFRNIEEGRMGEDRLTFKCAICGDNHTGTVYG